MYMYICIHIFLLIFPFVSFWTFRRWCTDSDGPEYVNTPPMVRTDPSLESTVGPVGEKAQ